MTRDVVGADRTGTCPPVHTDTTLTEYVDPTEPEPMKLRQPMDSLGGMKPLAGVTVMGCKFTASAQSSQATEPAPWLREFFLYRRVDIENETPLGTMKMTALSERGNVHALTPADASLFDIPPGFTAAPAPPPRRLPPLQSPRHRRSV
ncbi:MAG TPA: hypothetical protein VME66_05140 [Candidatus Acidoferrales bacterium]|nr:hypothetical protein [Candidatus Acidoferrales bacterium]